MMWDGLVFDASSTRGEVIREEGGYSGVRVHVQARLASARIAMHLAINFGDPIWPAPVPVDLPRLLGDHIRLLSYPDHMVLAEKIVTAIQRGTANTRWRDFTDIASIASARRIAETDLSQALARVAPASAGDASAARRSAGRNGAGCPAEVGCLATQAAAPRNSGATAATPRPVHCFRRPRPHRPRPRTVLEPERGRVGLKGDDGPGEPRRTRPPGHTLDTVRARGLSLRGLSRSGSTLSRASRAL